MGLTIHYDLRWAPPNPPPNDVSVRRFVQEVRRRIVRRQLGQVSPVRPAGGGPFDGLEFYKVRYAPRDGSESCDTFIDVKPAAGYLFTLAPGKGCEPATMGLCRYPASVWAQGREWRVKLPGWRLKLFSKTQYASVHGWEHFRQCHLAILTALEVWRDLGATVRIDDEGGYWPRRNERRLRRELDLMNGVVAAAAGALKDLADETGGAPVQSPILAHPQFERLEHAGQERVAPHLATLRKVVRSQ